MGNIKALIVMACIIKLIFTAEGNLEVPIFRYNSRRSFGSSKRKCSLGRLVREGHWNTFDRSF